MREVLEKIGKKELERAHTDNFTRCFVLKVSPKKNPPPTLPKESLYLPDV